MKTAITTITALVTATAAWAADATGTGTSLLTWLFLAFGALIVVFQAVPAAVLFATMVREMFARATAEAPKAR